MDKSFKALVIVLALLIVGLGAFTLGVTVGDKESGITLFGGSSQTDSDVIDEAIETIRTNSADPPSEEELVRAAVKGMLELVKEDDDYAGYLNQKAYEDFLDYSAGSFSGIGVNLSDQGERLEVLSVISGTPAEDEGLQRGDVFVSVDGEPVSEMTVEEAVTRVKGPAGTKVSLVILRDGEKMDFEITRDEIALPNLRGKLADDIGYIQLYGFAKGAGDELRDEVESLREKGADGIVLDLRDNGGGLVTEAISVASVFIEDGEIVTYREAGAEDQVFEAEGDAFEDIPLVVLVNGGTASASEIVANALQDQGRSQLVGTRTFGKGSVQGILRLQDSSAVKLTTGIYLSPNGEDINGSGIEPDVEVDAGRLAQRREAFDLVEQLVSSSNSQG
jgi:carboxyl-terminal processing protease